MIRRLEAVAAGRAALRVTGPATVFAVFERSFYVEADAGIACIGGAGLGLGPLNVTVAEPSASLGERIELEFGSASVWQPSSLPGRTPGRVPAHATAAWRNVPEAQAFLAWIGGGGLPDDGLIGRGPGLTPAGDDFVGGAMIALRVFGEAPLADRIACWALPLAETRTSRISRAHLACAAQGEGHEYLHELLGNLGSDTTARSSLGKLARVGHSSGLDAAAGALLALDRARREPARRPARSAGIR